MSKHYAEFVDHSKRERVVVRFRRKGDEITIDSSTIISLSDKEYREATRSNGLGDTLAKFTAAAGIHPCRGCKKRQKKLNELVPYK